MIRIIISLILFVGVLCSAFSKPINPADTANLEEAIHSKLDFILESGNLTNRLSEEDLANLPLGIEKDIGGINYIIIIDSVRFTANAAYLNAYASLEFTETGDRIAFAATGVKFQPGGLAATTSTKLQLISPKKIKLGENIDLLISPDGGNFVEFDCNGFKSIGVKGLFQFSEDILIPVDSKQKKVEAVFEGNFTDLNNIIASVSISPFKPKKFDEITVEVNEAIIDLSDIKNPASIEFPLGYTGDAFWEGFYLKSARITLPNELNENQDELHIDAQHLIIDKKGFSGNIGVANLFGTEDGNLNGWPFSIDSLGIHMVKNQVKGAAFQGKMVVPPFDKETPMNYYALIQAKDNGETRYQFNLQTTENIKASVLMAQIELDPGSSITVINEDGKLKPEANLHGSISVKSGDKLEIKKLRFEQLHLATEKPYIRSGVWSFTGNDNPSAGKFPISINEVKLSHSEDVMRLSLKIALNLMDSEDKGFSASSTVEVHAKMEEEAIPQGESIIYEHKWKYQKTTIATIELMVKTSAFSLEGRLDFYDGHETYGNGFRGEIAANFSKFAVHAVGQFGKVDGYRYWYVDAMVRLPAPIGSGFGIYGLGGGLSYHMTKKENPIEAANNFKSVAGKADSTSIGESRSPTQYIPDKNTGIGFKASVIIGIIPKPDPFNGVVTFEMEFNTNGGVNHIRFIGDAYFMNALDADASKAQVYAHVEIHIDFVNDVLHGELVTYVNVEGIITGIHERGRAGTAVIHIDEHDWYLHIGTPEQRIGLNFVGIVEATSYFMLGTVLHDFPNVTDVIPETLVGEIQDELDGFMRDENALGTGGGIAFGASLSISTGRQQMLMFYGEFDAGFGFDIMLRDYGDVRCEGESEPIGINGWYASGQSWIYLQAEIGISVNLTFVKGEFVIAQMGIASIVQAKLPNPLYMQGFVNGNYNILGGLVKGKFDFKFVIGEECTLVGDDATEVNIKVIADLQPQATEEVNVFTAPQVAFNVPIDEVFELQDDENGKYIAYKVELDHFHVKDGNNTIPGDLEWSEDRKTVIFNSFEILPPKSSLTAEVKITWFERIAGVWKAMGGSEPISEEEMITFQTGEAPDYIPESNVLYSYPATGMYHFYPKEYNEGYMELKSGQNYLFEDENFNYEVRLVPAGGMVGSNTPLFYSENTKSIKFNIPDGLENEQAYSILFVKSPKNATIVDENVYASSETLEDSDAATVEIETRELGDALVLEEEELLYESIFRTSRYNTFEDKLSEISFSSTSQYLEGLNMVRVGLRANAREVFDKIEIEGSHKSSPLISFLAHTDNDWYTNHIFPLNYEFYPVASSIRITWRETAPWGVPPLKAMYIDQRNPAPELSSEDLYSGSDASVGGNFVFAYDLSFYTYRDFKDLQQKALNLYGDNLNKIPTGAYRLLSRSFTNLKNEDYKFDVLYRLPGRNIVTTKKTYTIVR